MKMTLQIPGLQFILSAKLLTAAHFNSVEKYSLFFIYPNLNFYIIFSFAISFLFLTNF